MKTLIALFILALPCSAQVAQMSNGILVGPESITITDTKNLTGVSIPVLMQFGVPNKWCAPQTYKFPLVVSYSGQNLALCSADPAPGVLKSIYAQQQAAAYVVSYKTSLGVPATLTIPALVVTPPPVSSAATITLSGSTCTVTGSPITGSFALTIGAAK